ncbi:hypothetical protein AB0R12_12020 [Streptomyces niveus]|uniref:hypothetical protein n=1 Tax=Streptomyces niveus TaxID=193462 RepID=UPI0034365E62
MFFGGLGVYCALIALIPALRRLLRPLSAFLDDVAVPVSANLAYAVFLLLLAGAVASRKKAAWWLVVAYLALLVAVDVVLLTFAAWSWLPNFVLCGAGLVVLMPGRACPAARPPLPRRPAGPAVRSGG